MSAPFPRIWSYELNRGDGRPFVPTLTGTLDMDEVRRRARFPLQTLEVVPWANAAGLARPDVPFEVRRANPQTILLSYFQTGEWWLAPSFVPQAGDFSLYAEFHNCMKKHDAWLYNLDGTVHAYANVNWGNRPFALEAAEIFARGQRTHLWNGQFFDSYSSDVAWVGQGPTNLPFDLKRAGFATGAEMDKARRVNMGDVIAHVREAGGPGFLIVVNGTTPPDVQALWKIDGDLREGFPGSLTPFAKGLAFVQASWPTYRLLKAECSSALTSPADCQLARFTLGTACLGDGWAYIGQDRAACAFYDEYSVDAQHFPYNVADYDGKFTGWLGQPGDTRMVNGCYLRWFDHGAVVVNPNGVRVKVPLGMTMRHILGKKAPTVNTGQDTSSVTLEPRDARFLIRLPK